MRAQLEDFSALQARFELDVYGKRGIALLRGEGRHVFDAEGRRYLDCIAGHGAAILGHGHPAVIAALAEQSRRLISCSGAFGNDVRARYLQALMSVAPAGMQRAFLCNSGTEAVEAAMKLARLHSGRSEILACDGGFHGRTMGALSATSNPVYREPFAPLLPGVRHVAFNDGSALAAAISDRTAALIVEPIQGEGGVHPASPEFLRTARELCDRHGALLVLDEVQTGFGRTGTLFACQRHELRPDLICLAKGIANGVPMGALLARAGVDMPVGSHGSTFGGNPLACAAAEATLRVLSEGELAAAAEAKGKWLCAQLEAAELPLVREIRGRGLMVGIELRVRVKPVLDALMERGVLALAAGSRVLRLLPPLTVDKLELQKLAAALRETLSR